MGRDDLLDRLHNQLQSNERIGITGVKGLGGIGKTELALQYAIASYNEELYPGGVCWLQARDQEIATQIVSFAKAHLGIKPPDDLEADEQVRFTWQRWPQGDSLIVLDDVTDYDAIAPYLPPSDPRFKVLITTRLNLGSSVTQIEIEELTDESAIALLKSIVGDKRIESQRLDAEKLCEWVGNLPLGLELLGRFLVRKEDWAIAKLLKRLESKRLDAKALVSNESGMTASLGVAAALELSWVELNEEEQDLACLLGMFAVAPIPWNIVEQCFEDIDPDDLEDWRDNGLCDRSLIKRIDEGIYQLHQVVQEFFREKLKAKGEDARSLIESFGRVMVAIAQSIDETPTIDQIDTVRGAIAHFEVTINSWLESLLDDDKIWPFIGIGTFYQGQGNYGLAEPWYKQSFDSLKKLLGNNHPSVATSLNNLAFLYNNQGRYKDAKPLFLQALKLRKKLLGNDHPDVASSLNNLALLYNNQGRYEEAEPLYLQALELRKKLLGNDHPDVANSLNNLAALFGNQGRYERSEPLYIQALELRKKLLGNGHPHVATSLNNLAALYYNQGRYEKSEPLYLQALELRKKLLGNDHPHVATSLNNLALLYNHQGRDEEAEPLYIQALELWKKLLGNDHIDVASSLNNLAALYYNQGRYEEAEPLFFQAHELTKKLLGNEHPHVANSLNNLAALYDNQGRYEEAEPLYIQALELSKELLGNDHPYVAISLNNLAALYDNQGRHEEAEPLYIQALELRKKLLGNDHPDVASSYWSLGVLYARQSQYQKAKSLYLPALEIFQKRLGENHPSTQKLLSRINALPEGTEALPLEDLGLSP